jgi:uncharacterized protein YkwD
MPKLLKLWLVLAAVLALVAVGTAGTASASVADEVRVVQLVNEQRAAHGLPPMTMNDTLGAAAQGYAEYMASANFFAHKGLDGSTLVSRAEAAGYQAWSFLGENLAAGQPTPERVVDAWMKSPTHRANVLSNEGVEIGIGKAQNADSKYRVYWAMEIGSRWQ